VIVKTPATTTSDNICGCATGYTPKVSPDDQYYYYLNTAIMECVLEG